MVDQRFNKKLEDHKYELHLLMETNKFDFQRKAHDFTLYTTKKHAVYAELYDLYLRADGYVVHLLTQPNMILKDIRDKEELVYALTKSNFPEHLIKRFVDNWDIKNKKELFQELTETFEELDFDRTKKAIGIAKNSFLINRIY